MLRISAIWFVAIVFLSACSSGTTAPLPTPSTEACSDAFCVEIPNGWTAEVGDTWISAHHELDPSNTFLTAGVIDMEAIVTNAGGVWPVPTDEVTRAFWTLLEDADVGSFERSARVLGGGERSWGTHVDGDMWHLVSPVEGSRAIGIEMRAPNDTWESHADLVFSSLSTR